MHHKPSVLVQVDLDGRHIRLVVSGCVTELNHRALCPLVRRARTLAPDIAVVLDLTTAHHVEPVAVDLLLAVLATSLLRARIGRRAWRVVHWAAYAAWPVAVAAGTLVVALLVAVLVEQAVRRREQLGEVLRVGAR